jgi:hypothetical protein
MTRPVLAAQNMLQATREIWPEQTRMLNTREARLHLFRLSYVGLDNISRVVQRYLVGYEKPLLNPPTFP